MFNSAKENKFAPQKYKINCFQPKCRFRCEWIYFSHSLQNIKRISYEAQVKRTKGEEENLNSLSLTYNPRNRKSIFHIS